jgi:hypothetical protein
VRAVILQFGGYVVPVIKGQKDLDWYRQAFAKQLSIFKSLGLPIIMIGLGGYVDERAQRDGQLSCCFANSRCYQRRVHNVGGVFWGYV